VGRKKIIEDGINITIRVPKHIKERNRALGLKDREVYERGSFIDRPEDMSAIDYRINEIPHEIAKIERSRALLKAQHDIDDNKLSDARQELERELAGLETKKQAVSVREEKVLDEFVERYPWAKDHCRWSEGLHEPHPFFVERGFNWDHGMVKDRLKKRFGY
jgi:hypothetical protein